MREEIVKKIGQREARRLRKRVDDLEEQRKNERAAWARSYPGGKNLGEMTLAADWFRGRLEAAQILEHPIVVVMEGAKCKFYALPAV